MAWFAIPISLFSKKFIIAGEYAGGYMPMPIEPALCPGPPPSGRDAP